MNKRAPRVAPAIQDAAAEFGLSPAALLVYMQDRGMDGVSPDLFQGVTTELKARANSLRLDDLGKIALTVDWLAEHALGTAEPIQSLQAQVETLKTAVEGAGQSDEVEALSKRLKEVESQLGKAGSDESAKSALQVAAGLQSLVESQGREIDQLRSELAAAQREIAEVAKSFKSFTHALRSALDDGGAPSGKVKAQNGAVSAVEVGQSQETPSQTAPAFENTPVTNALRYGIRREIEYNYLLERMSFRRLDSYSNEELTEGKNIPVPTDSEIQQFLAKYEVGGNPEEVEIVTVHRGEFQMVQYQRVEKPSGLRGWMPKQKK